MKRLLPLVFLAACHPTTQCPAPDDGGLTPAVNPCVQVDQCGAPVLDGMGRPIPKPEGSPCKLGGLDGTCKSHECVLTP